MITNPYVCCIIVTFNGERYIAKCLNNLKRYHGMRVGVCTKAEIIHDRGGPALAMYKESYVSVKTLFHLNKIRKHRAESKRDTAFLSQ